MTHAETGTTAGGVPYLVVPSGTPGAPVVVGWHLMDPPRTEAAFAAALPLEGLDATKIYLGLPNSGARMPAGGIDEIMRLGFEEPVMNLHWPVHEQAVAEFPDAFAELRARFGVAPEAAVGLLGGSAGSSVAAGVLATGASGARAAVFVSPMLRLRPLVDELAVQFGMDYTWTPESSRAAERMDFAARAAEITATGAAVRIVLGLDDGPAIAPAREVAAAIGADLQELDGVDHALADEPGVEAAPQTEAARRVDALAAAWFRDHLN